MASMANESAVAAQAMAALNAESAANAVRLAAHDQIPLDPTPADEVAALRSRIAALETERDTLALTLRSLRRLNDLDPKPPLPALKRQLAPYSGAPQQSRAAALDWKYSPLNASMEWPPSQEDVAEARAFAIPPKWLSCFDAADHPPAIDHPWSAPVRGFGPPDATPGSTAPDDSRGSDKDWRRLAYGQPATTEPDPRSPPPLPARALGQQHQTVGNGGRLTGLWR